MTTIDGKTLPGARPSSLPRPMHGLRTLGFLGPAGFLIVLMFAAPILISLVLSLTDMGASLKVTRLTTEHYERMLFADTRLRSAVALSVAYTGLVVVFNVAIAVTLAIATTGINPLPGTVYRIFWLLPRISPVVVYCMLIKIALSPSDAALLNSLLAGVGLEPINLLDSHAFAVIVAASVLVGASLGMIVFTAAIRSIPQHLYFAAAADGAGRWGQIRHVVLPALKWQIAFISAFQMLSFLASLEIIILITDGGPFFDTTTYPVYAANRAFSTGQYAYGAALSTGLVLIGVALAILTFRLQRGRTVLERPRIEIG